MFGKTHKEWQQQNPNLKGNQRDHATVLDNAIMSNLEFQNSLLINQGYSQNERFTMLKELEQSLRTSMGKSSAMKRLEQQVQSKQIEKSPKP